MARVVVESRPPLSSTTALGESPMLANLQRVVAGNLLAERRDNNAIITILRGGVDDLGVEGAVGVVVERHLGALGIFQAQEIIQRGGQVDGVSLALLHPEGVDDVEAAGATL